MTSGESNFFNLVGPDVGKRISGTEKNAIRNPIMIKAFQEDYGIISAAITSREQESNSGSIMLPDLEVHIIRTALQIPSHGVGDVVAIKDRENGQYIVLWGETNKGRLDRGIGGGRLALQAPEKEVKAIFDKWEKYFGGLKSGCRKTGDGSPDKYELMDKIAATMQPLDIEAVKQGYVEPVFGAGAMRSFEKWQQLIEARKSDPAGEMPKGGVPRR